jgi:glucosamine 6-phosphate synthetase-like amidotransferase/phosphosugar isomerase protein
MCGIFGILATTSVNKKDLYTLIRHSEQRGKDSSGLVFLKDGKFVIRRADYNAD